MTTPNIYHHMGKLVQAKFVNTRIDRNRNYYSFNKNYINQLLDELILHQSILALLTVLLLFLCHMFL